MISCDHSINGIFATILKLHMGKKSEVFVEKEYKTSRT